MAFSKEGPELTIGVSVLHSNGGQGTLYAVQRGEIAAGKAAGATSVTLRAIVANAKVEKFLTGQGFKTVVKNGKTFLEKTLRVQ